MNRLRALFLAPTAILLLLLFAVPMMILAAYSLLTRGAYGGVFSPWTLESWQRAADPLYIKILLVSILVAAISTLISLLLGFPLALFIAQCGRWKGLLLSLVMLPFWTSFLIRTYAWMFLLRDTGLINTALIGAGMIDQPLPLLYNYGAVILGLVYTYLPFMVLPLYASLERMDRNLTEASADLGAPPLRTVMEVILPLSLPGIRAGCILVFIPCLGAYLIPDLLGGGKTILIGTLIQNQFSTSRDWPFGAALSLALMGLVLILLMLMLRRGEEAVL